MLKVGDTVPNLTLESSSGKSLSLTDFKGKKIVLYFYPKDDTPGCTKEACSFREENGKFRNLNAVILGVSKDPISSHEKFIEKYGLPFELLSDTDHKLAETFGVWGEKSLYGKIFMGMNRSTFLIDEEGIIRQIWKNVKVDGHSEDVLEAAKAL